MSKFYTFYPTTKFENKILTDLGVRLKIRDTWLYNPRLYYNYNYQDHDKPEHIALKYYGDEELHWIILITNNIFDVNFDFPMNYTTFGKYIEDKYKELGALENKTGLEYAMTTPDPVYRYQKHIRMITTSGVQDKYFVVGSEMYYNLYEYDSPSSSQIMTNSGEYVTYQVSRRYPEVTYYDRELDEIESKRLIKILKKDYLQQAKTDILRLLK